MYMYMYSTGIHVYNYMYIHVYKIYFSKEITYVFIYYFSMPWGCYVRLFMFVYMHVDGDTWMCGESWLATKDL